MLPARGHVGTRTIVACLPQRDGDSLVHVSKLPMEPSPEFSAEEVMYYILEGLKHNDFPEIDAGLKRCFAFSNNMCRSAVGGDDSRAGGTTVEHFIKYASNPTFQSLVRCEKYEREDMNFLPSSPTRGALATQIAHITTKNGDKRRFLWTLEQERRPPQQGCWLIRQCLYTKNAFLETI
ncbi:hypothetical protein GUITHDRAFT_148590 [Guillardia theta CCMP2712]|uniref:Uncharacterized protein n=1 Tax=Guillardia theta (strain CCMP2712) TaxID=905079 RepID=L1I8C0_GUITC|nr:hypothetical protein GUITHDRAFT_148590 [Guillardia theta CCMP2712]EKX32478.1 hypothetical protein GUITHDRAFT_148590 [Guillardia theta CCMP2712]|eukprot:XP_005819458.1 hypothetical protein GUITHDRAFT_148590 [Guillardia theta CCMP2712]